LNLLWTGQQLKNPNLGASSVIPFASSLNQVNSYHIVQVGDNVQLSPSLRLETRLGYVFASLASKLQERIRQQSGVELFKGIYSGAAPLQNVGTRDKVLLTATLQHTVTRMVNVFGSDFTGKNYLQIGAGWEELFSSNQYSAYDNLNLQFFDGLPYSVVLLNTPAKTSQRVRNLSLFVQNNTDVSLFALDIGLRLQSSVGWLPSGQEAVQLGNPFIAQRTSAANNLIQWTTFSPRVGVVVPLSKQIALRTSYARYYHQLLANYLDFQNPQALSGNVFLWNDKNGNRQFQQGEQGRLLKVFGGQYSTIDPNLKAPFTDEVTIGADFDFGGNVQLGITLLHRYEQRLVETINIGVPFSAYSPVTIFDRGGDDRAGTSDDQQFTVYNQDSTTLGKDSYVLTNPDGHRDFYQGVELVARSEGWLSGLYVQLAFAAYMIVGRASQEGESLEYDQGIVGNLYDNPNTLINADNRLFFDRAFLGKIVVAYQSPWDLNISGIAKYYDGLPFGRKLVVTGMNQGPFYIFTTPRGNKIVPDEHDGHRVEYNLTVDASIEKIFHFREHRLGVRLDVFNLLNFDNKTREIDLSGPMFMSRIPREIQAPRIFRIGLNYEF
jgi:hypothetical protein